MAVIRTNFLSKTLVRQVDVNVVIPTYAFRHDSLKIDSYSKNKKFKVLILLNGFSGDCNDFLTFTNAARYAEKNNLALIMPSGLNSGYIDEPDGLQMHSFIAHELLEVCSFLFPISTRREDVYIGGLSMGAMGAARIALAHPETFSEVFIMSGAPKKIDNKTMKYKETQEDAFYCAEKNIKDKKPLPRFMISVGLDDFLLEDCRTFHHFMEELGYEMTCNEIPDYGHEWDFWEKEIRNAIEHYFTH